MGIFDMACSGTDQLGPRASRQDRAIVHGRRGFCLLATLGLFPPSIAGAVGSDSTAPAEHPDTRASLSAAISSDAFLYVAIGPELTAWKPDPIKLTLTRTPGSGLTLPAPIQYVWPHPTLPLLYVAYSDRAGMESGQVHGVQVAQLSADGRLEAFGAALPLDNRPIHLILDGAGRHMLVAFNSPSDLRVFHIDGDGSIGRSVIQPGPIDAGIYAHQVRVSPDDRTVILVTRGNDATAVRPEDPGALKVFAMDEGELRFLHSVAPGGGYGFGPRHLEFGANTPFAYVSLERENRLDTFAISPQGPEETPRFQSTTLASLSQSSLRQLAGAIHLSRTGDVVYVANRADSRQMSNGASVFAGGENTIAVFRISPVTGEPTLIQTVGTERFHPRTFSVHPSGRMLVAAAIKPMPVQDGERVRIVSAGLSIFEIMPDERLRLHSTVDLDAQGGDVFWCGMVSHPT